MRSPYPAAGSGNDGPLRGRASVAGMVLWGFWVLATLLNPARFDAALFDAALFSPAQRTPALVLGLAVVAAALLVAAVTALPVLLPAAVPGLRAFARRARTAGRPRLLDPDAPGRPRPRAPDGCPAVA